MFVSSLLSYIRECCFVEHQKLIIYYTDWYDVDEDLTIICKCGGKWSENIGYPGITDRDLVDAPSTTLDYVASSNTKKSLIIQMDMMSTKA